jgi:hypothetical protein
MVRAGKHPAWRLTRARMPLKADAVEGRDGCSDSQIVVAPDITTVARTRQQLWRRASRPCSTASARRPSARPRIFDGASEAKMIGSEPPKGRKRWTLKLPAYEEIRIISCSPTAALAVPACYTIVTV